MHTLILKLALGAAIVASAPAADAASDYLLELDGVKGESKSSASVQEWEWSRAMATGSFDPFQPAFAGGVRVASGDLDSDGRWESLVLTATSVDGSGSFFRYEMKDVMVTSWQTSAAGSHSKWLTIEAMSTPIMRWAPPTATGGRSDWIEATWDRESGRLIGNAATLNGLDDLQAWQSNYGSVHIAAVPEPESWALMLLGAAAIGARLRQRREPA